MVKIHLRFFIVFSRFCMTILDNIFEILDNTNKKKVLKNVNLCPLLSENKLNNLSN